MASNNNTSISLVASDTWISNKENVDGFASVVVSVKTDVAGTLSIQYSGNGSDYDLVDSFSISGGVAKSCQSEVKARWCRIEFTNSGVPQTYLRLFTCYKQIPQDTDVKITSMPSVTITPDTILMYRNLDLSITGQVVKNSAGKLYGILLFNKSGTDHYVKVYDKATAATSADTPKLTVWVQANSHVSHDCSVGIPFSSGISVRGCVLIADNNNDALSTNDCLVNILYA